MKTNTLALLFLLFLVANAHARGFSLLPVDNSPKVKAELLADTDSIAPSKPFTVGVSITTGPKHHIYWINPGEGGLPTRFEWKLPTGFKVEALPQPLPYKFVQPGNITGYGYSGTATFLFTITPPASLPAGPFEFEVESTWLNCDDTQCTPGSAKLKITLPPGNGTLNAKLADAHAALPVPLTPAIATSRGTLTSKISSNAAGIFLPFTFKEAPKSVEVFPTAIDAIDVKMAEATVDKENITISLSVHIFGGQQLKTPALPVLIVYTAADGKRHGFFVDADLSALIPRNP